MCGWRSGWYRSSNSPQCRRRPASNDSGAPASTPVRLLARGGCSSASQNWVPALAVLRVSGLEVLSDGLEFYPFSRHIKVRNRYATAAEGPWSYLRLQGLSQTASPSRISQSDQAQAPYIEPSIADCDGRDSAPATEYPRLGWRAY